MIPQIYSMIEKYSTCNLCHVCKQYMEDYSEHDGHIVCYTGKYYFHRQLDKSGYVFIKDQHMTPICDLPKQYKEVLF